LYHSKLEDIIFWTKRQQQTAFSEFNLLLIHSCMKFQFVLFPSNLRSVKTKFPNIVRSGRPKGQWVYTLLCHVRFPQWCCCRFKSSGMWHCC